MKKILITLLALSLVFTACTISKSDEEKTGFDLSLEDLNTVENTNEDKSAIEVSTEKAAEGLDSSQELLGEFDILVNEDYDFSKLEYKAAELDKNLAIENIVKESFFKDNEDPKYSYTYNYTNLNDDEFNDVIVLLGGSEFAGSGGSSLMILKGEPEGKLTLINKVTLARTPIVVTDTYSNGYKDLLFVVYGGGSQTAYKIMKYDGSKYPLNPSIQLEAQVGRVFEGEALIGNTEYYKSLIHAGEVE